MSPSPFSSDEALAHAANGRWLRRPTAASPYPAVDPVSTDSRAIAPGQAFVALKGDRFDAHDFLDAASRAGARCAVVERDVALPAGSPTGLLRVASTRAALLALGAAHRRSLANTRVLAVGGSNGKTTCVRLLGAALSASLRGRWSPKSFNNDVGVPVTLLSARPDDLFLVCEVGTNAPGEIEPLARAVAPDAAIITSLGREHLEGLGSIDAVAREEAALLTGLRPGGLALVADDPVLVDHARAVLGGPAVPAGLLTFGPSASADIRITNARHEHLNNTAGVAFTVETADTPAAAFWLPLLGTHNALAAGAVVALARWVGLADDAIRAGLARAEPAPMRLSPQRTRNVCFLNDAYNANPESMIAAFKVFADPDATPRDIRRRGVVLGEMLEQGDAGPVLHLEVLEHLVATVGPLDPAFVALVGDLFARHTEWLRSALPRSTVVHASRTEVSPVAALLREGDYVLLKGSRATALERVADAWSKAGAQMQEPKPAGAARV